MRMPPAPPDPSGSRTDPAEGTPSGAGTDASVRRETGRPPFRLRPLTPFREGFRHGPPPGVEASSLAWCPWPEALLENLPYAAWMKDRELRYVAVNAAFLEEAGCSREAVVGRRGGEVEGARPGMEREEETDCRVVADGREVATVELRVHGSDRRRRWVEVVKRPIRGADGGVVGMVGLAHDVTERVRREQEERFLAEAGQAIIASIGWTETVQGLLSLLVPRMAEWCVVSVFGSDGRMEQIRGHASRREVDDALEALVSAEREAFGHGGPVAGSVLASGKGRILPRVDQADLDRLLGRSHPAAKAFLSASVMLVPLLSGASAVGLVVLGRQEDRRSYDRADLRLLEKVGTRAALAIEHTRQHRRATEALAARDRVLGIVAHDLHGMVGMASLALGELRAELSGRAEAGAERVMGILEDMDRLVRDLGEVARAEEGPLPLARDAHRPGDLIRHAAEVAGPVARSRKISLAADGDGDAPAVWADRGRVLQVLSNLLGNALDHTGPGGAVRLETEPADGEVVFAVRDTGSGMPAEELRRVFEPFWRGEGATGDGCGLGLSIARGIVTGHGGRMWATSQQGRGSCFCFTLPSADRPQGDGGADGTRAVCEAEAAAPALPARVLVVDDHPAIRAGVCAALEGSREFRVVAEAGDGEEAVRCASRLSGEDVVVLDLVLPGMDGFEAMRRIRARQDGPRVLVLTAHAAEASLLKALKAGASGFLRKAAAEQELMTALRTVRRGDIYLDPHGNRVLLHALERTCEIRRRLARLSESEREVVRLTAEGYTGKEAAERLFLAPGTVSVYRMQAMRKLGLEHRSQLVRFALEAGLVCAGSPGGPGGDASG